MKTCKICNEPKEDISFGKLKMSKDGLRHECRDCRKSEYYENHELIKQQKRNDYQKHKETRNQQSKEKYQQNKELKKKQANDYYYDNKEIILQKQKIYREENREHRIQQKREYEQSRRDKKKLEQELLKSQQITVNYPPDYKICSKCHTLKQINEINFNRLKNKNTAGQIKYRGFCKECQSKDWKNYHQENGDEIRTHQRQYHKQNPEIVKETARKHRKSESFKIRHALPKNRIIRNMTQYIRFALGEEGLKKDGRATMKYVGCSRQFFRDYIQSQFKEGMNWENYGNGPDQWSVDHFVPKEAFNILNSEEQDICFNWKNCQPMWHLENEAKQDKMPDGSFARDTKDNYSLNDKINLIENRVQSLNIPLF